MDLFKGIRAVLFDLDGTLVDSMWMWEKIDLEFLGSRGISLPSDLQKTIEGMSFTETAEYFKNRFELKESLEELKEIWNGMAMQKYRTQVPMKPGAKELLSYLKKKNIRMGIATSNSKELVRAVFEAHSLGEYITTVVTSCEVARGKPEPDVYLCAAQRLSTEPESCLVFEDVPMGILAGKRAGMRVCAVWDAASAFQDEEKKQLADEYIHSFENLHDDISKQ